MKSTSDAIDALLPSEPELSARTREANLERMRLRTFDIAVIGGGITGAGIALDAASRGLSAALVEKNDFASGTSSRSSKLIHGGLRYLEQRRFSLVREALRERASLMKLAPHLARPLGFIVPLYEKDRPSPLGSNRLKLGLGLSLYDLLARGSNIKRHSWLDAEQVGKAAPLLDQDHLRGAFLYYDCLTDDARLVIEVIKTAAAYGAIVANYAAVESFEKSGRRLTGLNVKDRLTGNTFTLRARLIINASGVWSDQVSSLAEGHDVKRLQPSKGIHLVLPADKFRCERAVLIPSRGEQRFLFVIPWHGRTIVGTTDTAYTGEIDNPRAEANEIARVLESAAVMFPEARLSTHDVISAFAGLRPLIGSDASQTSDLSRESAIIESRSGLISLIGGKLTTYRHMAEQVVNLAAKNLARNFGVVPAARSSRTEQISLTGEAPRLADLTDDAKSFGVAEETVAHLMNTYGGRYREVLRIAATGTLKRPLSSSLSHIEAEAVYAARREMAVRVEDFLNRRTRIALLTRNRGAECAAAVGELLGVSDLSPIS
ncbi:MAG: hypothetical protein DMF61_10995 [Blastocatellia bacterium AA13]|nr:MAG: hypothetical protein DMF61_10995 [Blastocatellia bacterium AA13]